MITQAELAMAIGMSLLFGALWGILWYRGKQRCCFKRGHDFEAPPPPPMGSMQLPLDRGSELARRYSAGN